MIFEMVAQIFGCLVALAIAFCMRVRVRDEESGKDYLVPNVYSQPPPLLVVTDGIPSYGQLMLCEMMAALILVLTSL